MKIAIVILNWNGRDLLERFLPSVLKYSVNHTVYIADNASNDDSIQFVEEKFPQVTIIRSKLNGGYAKGYNDALKEIDADVYCLLNSDVEVSSGWLKPIENLMSRAGKIAIVQPKILDCKQKENFEYAGAGGGFIDQLGYPYCRGRIFKTIETDKGQYNDTTQIFWASGACMFIKSTAFKELGGFDEDYFAHQEEIDLCWRAHNMGYVVWYTGDSVVYHLGGATLNNMHPKKTFLNFRNSLFTLTKNLPVKMVLPFVFCRLILDGLAGVQFLFQGKLEHIIAIFKAHLSYYSNLKKMLGKRKPGPKSVNYFKNTSIVWDYFVRNKKKFSELIKD